MAAALQRMPHHVEWLCLADAFASNLPAIDTGEHASTPPAVGPTAWRRMPPVVEDAAPSAEHNVDAADAPRAESDATPVLRRQLSGQGVVQHSFTIMPDYFGTGAHDGCDAASVGSEEGVRRDLSNWSAVSSTGVTQLVDTINDTLRTLDRRGWGVFHPVREFQRMVRTAVSAGSCVFAPLNGNLCVCWCCVGCYHHAGCGTLGTRQGAVAVYLVERSLFHVFLVSSLGVRAISGLRRYGSCCRGPQVKGTLC